MAFNTLRALVVRALLALALTAVAGCAPHADAPQAPAGMKVGQPLSQAQLQAMYQQRAARQAKQTP